MSLKEKAAQIKKYVPAVFIAMKKKETPFVAKFCAVLTVSYALSPIDLIPDFIPVLGYLDDLIILPLLITLTIKCIPTEVLQLCLAESENLWKDGKPKKWYYAIPIVLFWLVLVVLIARKFVHF